MAENLNEIPINFLKNFTMIENGLKCNEKKSRFNSAKFFQEIMDENLKDFGFDNIQDFRRQVTIKKNWGHKAESKRPYRLV